MELSSSFMGFASSPIIRAFREHSAAERHRCIPHPPTQEGCEQSMRALVLRCTGTYRKERGPSPARNLLERKRCSC